MGNGANGLSGYTTDETFQNWQDKRRMPGSGARLWSPIRLVVTQTPIGSGYNNQVVVRLETWALPMPGLQRFPRCRRSQPNLTLQPHKLIISQTVKLHANAITHRQITENGGAGGEGGRARCWCGEGGRGGGEEGRIYRPSKSTAAVECSDGSDQETEAKFIAPLHANGKAPTNEVTSFVCTVWGKPLFRLQLHWLPAQQEG